MYSHYMDGRFVPLGRDTAARSPDQAPQDRRHRPEGLAGEVTGGISQLLGGILKQFSVERLDSGDILLVLIILFLFLEGDNLELVITLGLMLLLGLSDD